MNEGDCILDTVQEYDEVTQTYDYLIKCVNPEHNHDESEWPVLAQEVAACVVLRVTFTNAMEFAYPIHDGGDWYYTDDAPLRLIVRPQGPKHSRHEIPLSNVLSIFVVIHKEENDDAGE